MIHRKLFRSFSQRFWLIPPRRGFILNEEMDQSFSSFDAQIARIKLKLLQAKYADPEFRVFGASGHKYIILDPVSDEDVTHFEEVYSLALPKCYRNFITKIGNGGINRFRSAAGPNFGIFPFGHMLNFLMSYPEKYLRGCSRIFPGMSDNEWDELIAPICSDERISDEDYEVGLGKVFGGILPLGSQGCSIIHCLIINGPHAGRVVKIDVALSKPVFENQNNFLDWYERWLDDIIGG